MQLFITAGQWCRGRMTALDLICLFEAVSNVHGGSINSCCMQLFATSVQRSWGVGWSVEFFLIGQNRSTNQRSGMNSKISPANACQSFTFSQNSRGPKYYIFCENWHAASFYIKEQTHKCKFEIWLLKSTSTILDPRKSRFLVFVETPPPQKKKKIHFFVFWPWFSFLNNRHTNVLMFSNFENAQKKLMQF